MKSHNVLIVEDEPAIGLAIRYTVDKYFNCDVTDLVNNGAEAWEKILTTQYDLIISDWNMPHKNGNELLADTRARDKNIPFLMLTARSDRISVSTAIKSGANAYLVKPFERNSLIRKIEQLLHVDRLHLAPKNTEDAAQDTASIIDQIAKKLKSGGIEFPVLQDVAATITDALNDDERDIESITKVLKLDPSIPPKLIGLSNSVYYKGSSTIMSTEDAVMRIGLKQTKSVALMTIHQSLYNCKNQKFETILFDLWRHASAVACCARCIAQFLSVTNVEKIFTMGQLHDVGKLILIKLIIEKHPELDEAGIKSIMSALHTQAGAAVLKEWKVPIDIVESALLHHDVLDGQNFSLEIRIVGFANVFIRTLGMSSKTAEKNEMEELALSLDLGLTQEQLDKLSVHVDNELKQLEVMTEAA